MEARGALPRRENMEERKQSTQLGIECQRVQVLARCRTATQCGLVVELEQEEKVYVLLHFQCSNDPKSLGDIKKITMVGAKCPISAIAYLHK